MYITDETLCPSAVQDSRCTARQSCSGSQTQFQPLSWSDMISIIRDNVANTSTNTNMDVFCVH